MTKNTHNKNNYNTIHKVLERLAHNKIVVKIELKLKKANGFVCKGVQRSIARDGTICISKNRNKCF